MDQNYAYQNQRPSLQAPQGRLPKNGFGTSSLVLGVAAATAAFYSPGGGSGLGAGVVLAILAIAFGIVGIRRANTGLATNKASAVAGTAVTPAVIVAPALSAMFTG